jgi:hypothetical protein
MYMLQLLLLLLLQSIKYVRSSAPRSTGVVAVQ